MAPKADGVEQVAVEQNSSTNDESMEPHWKQGDRVHAQWRGNGCYYLATVNEVYAAKRAVLITWDDEDGSHREISFDNIMEPAEETQAWNTKRIDRRVNVQDTPDKGRCLYTNEVSDPGQVVFVEKPCLVALPGLSQNLWNHLTKMHEATPLQLGTVTFHFAALLSELQLDKTSIGIIMDKYVPDPDEEPGDDVVRIMQSLEENKELKEELKLDERPLDPRKLQRLVSAWRYNSFGHHKEDGLVLYNRISMCSHSCDPTCCWSYGEDDAFVLRSRISLKKGDELTISYLQDEDLLKSTAVRQQKLQNWRFTCACPRCKLYVDEGRGFRCRKCRVGVLYATTGSTLEPCRVCNSVPSPDETQMLIHLEEEYVTRVESLDKTDVPDVERVYIAALDIFERHWILYVMDTMLWEAAKEKNIVDSMMEHQRRRIDFHEHYYCRPTFILAWCREEFGDCLNANMPNRKWQCTQEYQRAYQMLAILCGTNHQYTAGPYNKLWQVNGAAEAAKEASKKEGEGGST